MQQADLNKAYDAPRELIYLLQIHTRSHAFLVQEIFDSNLFIVVNFWLM